MTARWWCRCASILPGSPRTCSSIPPGSDDGVCLTDSPCATLDRAYRVANPGQVVELRSGHYPLQTIQERTSAGGEPVLFRPAKDASVVIDELTVEAANVAFRELTIGQLDVHPTAHDSTYFRVQISGGGFGNEGADRVAILGSTIGPGNPNEYSITSGGRDFNLSTTRLTGYANDDARGCCGTCLVVSSGDGVALRANRFDRCADVAIDVAVWGEGGPPRNLLVENSFLQVDVDGRGTAIGVGEIDPDNVLVRNNSMNGVVEFAAASEPSRFEVLREHRPRPARLPRRSDVPPEPLGDGSLRGSARPRGHPPLPRSRGLRPPSVAELSWDRRAFGERRAGRGHRWRAAAERRGRGDRRGRALAASGPGGRKATAIRSSIARLRDPGFGLRGRTTGSASYPGTGTCAELGRVTARCRPGPRRTSGPCTAGSYSPRPKRFTIR